MSMPQLRRFAFRVDASAAIGIGHVMRCLAFACALRDTGAVSTFLCRRLPADLRAKLSAEGFSVIMLGLPEQSSHQDRELPFHIDQQYDSDEVLDVIARSDGWDCLIVDHYGLDAVWERAVRGRVSTLVVIDDLANRAHECDVLIDQNLQPAECRYREWLRSPCKLLLGPRYALLRPEFVSRRTRKAPENLSGTRRVVLFAGGGDPENATGRLLDAWEMLGPERPILDVVIGSSHPSKEELQERCRSLAGTILHVQTDRMAALLADADLLIGAAGSVSWERCCLGLPALMFSIAANQESNIQMLSRRRTGISLGRAEDLDRVKVSKLIGRIVARHRLLNALGRRAAALVDGLGAMRVALMLRSGSVTVRAAKREDDKLVWPWRNSAFTRRYFRDSRELTWSEHRDWWSQSLKDDSRKLLIAHSGRREFGVVRFDGQGDSAEVSIYLDPDFTGLGLGSAALRAAQSWLAQGDMSWKRLEAEILPDNLASQKAFAVAGFQHLGSRWHWTSGR